MQAVFDLATVDPHEPAGRAIPAAEWETYARGYHRALQVALQVMELAEVRWRLWLKEKRRRLAQARASAPASVALLKQELDEHIPVPVDRSVDRIEEPAELAGADSKLERPVTGGVGQSEFVYVGPRFALDFPATHGMSDRHGHSGSYRIETKNEQPLEGKAGIVSQAGLPSVTTTSHPCSDARQSTVAHESRSPGQREFTKPRTRRRRG